jgi:hypothetical protein
MAEVSEARKGVFVQRDEKSGKAKAAEVIRQLHHRVEQLVTGVFLLLASDGAEPLARRATGKHLYLALEGFEPGKDGRISDIPLNDFGLWVVRPVGFGKHLLVLVGSNRVEASFGEAVAKASAARKKVEE